MGRRLTRRGAADSAPTRREKTDIGGVAAFFSRIAALHPDRERISFVCIGTDRSTGDSFGPLIGTLLWAQGWPHVIGTLDAPCDADRYERAVAGIPDENTVIAIDACLGKIDPSLRYLIADGPLVPGCATGRPLAPLGRYSLAGIVAPLGVKPYWNLQRASLNQVLAMARETAEAAGEAWKPADDCCPKKTASSYTEYTDSSTRQGKG